VDLNQPNRGKMLFFGGPYFPKTSRSLNSPRRSAIRKRRW
jgi:hypothetical protein